MNKCILLHSFPTEETLPFQSLDLGVVRCFFLPSPKTGTEPQRWNRGTVEPWNLLLGCKAGFMIGSDRVYIHDSGMDQSYYRPKWMIGC